MKKSAIVVLGIIAVSMFGYQYYINRQTRLRLEKEQKELQILMDRYEQEQREIEHANKVKILQMKIKALSK